MAAGVILVGTAVGAVAGGSVAVASKSPYRILMLVPASTSYQKTSVQTIDLMARAGATVVNKSGGVDGHKVVLTVVNDGATPTTAVTKLESALASANKPDVVINADGGAEASAELPILTSAKILSFNEAPTTTSGNPKMFPYNFDMSPSTTSYAAVFSPYVKAHGGKSVGILYGSNSYDVSINKAWVAAVKKTGLKLTDSVQYNNATLTMVAELETLQASHPDYLFADAYLAQAGYLVPGPSEDRLDSACSRRRFLQRSPRRSRQPPRRDS